MLGVCVCCIPQLYTQVESFASAISKLQELGLAVDVEGSELVYRGAAGAWRRRARTCKVAAVAAAAEGCSGSSSSGSSVPATSGRRP